MTELTSYVESGAIRPFVDTVYPLSDIAAAHRALEQGGRRRGRQVIRMTSPVAEMDSSMARNMGAGCL